MLACTMGDDGFDSTRANDDAIARLHDAIELGPPNGTHVESVRAIFDAHNAPMPPLAKVAQQVDATLEESLLRLTAVRRVAARDRDVHVECALAIRAGMLDPTTVLTDLVWHAVLGDIAEHDHVLGDAIAHAVASGHAERAFDCIERALAQLDQTPGRALVHVLRLAAELAVEIDRDAAGAIERWRTDALRAADEESAARAAYRESFLVDAATRNTLLRSVASGATRWRDRAQALLLVDGDDAASAVAHDRLSVFSAVRDGDAELEASSLLLLANLTGHAGDARTAIRLQERGARLAHRHGAWRAATIGWANLAWLALDRCDVRLANDAVEKLSAIATLHGVAMARFEALLLETGIASVVGDAHRASAALRELDRARRSGADRADEFDEMWLSMRELDARVASGEDDADRALRGRAHTLANAHGDDTIAFELHLVECRLERDLTTFEFLADGISSAEATFAALALIELSSAAALRDEDDLRELLGRMADSCSHGTAPILDRAIEHARALTRRLDAVDLAALQAIADAWSSDGFTRAGALASASVAAAAARQGRGELAAKRFDIAHRRLVAIGAIRDIVTVRAARDAAAGDATVRSSDPADHHVDLLDDLEDETVREAIEAMLVARTLASGVELPRGVIAWVASGPLVERRNSRAKRLHGPGCAIGLAQAVTPEDSDPSQFVALGPCNVRVLPVAWFEAEAARSPAIALAIARAMARAAKDVRFDDVTVRLEARLARALLHTGDQLGWTPAPPTGRRASKRVGRTLLADLVGASREAVSREIATFESAGIVRRDGQHIVIVDEASLFEAASLAPQA